MLAVDLCLAIEHQCGEHRRPFERRTRRKTQGLQQEPAQPAIDECLHLYAVRPCLPRELRGLHQAILLVARELLDFAVVVAALKRAEELAAFRILQRTMGFVAGSDYDIERPERQSV